MFNREYANYATQACNGKGGRFLAFCWRSILRAISEGDFVAWVEEVRFESDEVVEAVRELGELGYHVSIIHLSNSRVKVRIDWYWG